MSESVQWSLLAPLFLLLIMGIIQVGVWAHGRQVALDAAVAGAETEATLEGGGSADSVAQSVAARGGLLDTSISVSAGTETVTVTVSGTMPSFVDVGLTRVNAQATRAKERVTNQP